jgi:hypothetical protein
MPGALVLVVQIVPFGTGVYTQAPVAVLQESAVQTLLSSQTLGVKTHPVDATQMSVVQALLSLQTIGV